jgi:centromeric protein E
MLVSGSNVVRGSVYGQQIPYPMSTSTSSSSSSSANTPGQGNNEIKESHINVCVRIRPLLRDEIFKGHESIAWNWENNSIYQSSAVFAKKLIPAAAMPLEGIPRYNYDHVFQPEQTNEVIFDSCMKSLIRKTMCGFHSSVFTYGQTASGKTHTMSGNSRTEGLISMAVKHCFHLIQEYKDREFLFRVSYMEVYNEQVRDLLSTSSLSNIKIQHGAKVGTVISGVKEEVVLGPEHVLALIAAGNAQRHVGSTDMNEKSSRAHTLFKLIVESRLREEPITSPDKSSPFPVVSKGKASSTPKSAAVGRSKQSDNTDSVTVSYLCMADLAGSENAKMTKSTGVRAKEAKYINQSLLTLSTIIHKLSEIDSRPTQPTTPGGKQAPAQPPVHLPYRDSKLTRLMQSSLSGEANIVLICTISPTLQCFEETNNTLKFAQRAKRVRVAAKLNESNGVICSLI